MSRGNILSLNLSHKVLLLTFFLFEAKLYEAQIIHIHGSVFHIESRCMTSWNAMETGYILLKKKIKTQNTRTTLYNIWYGAKEDFLAKIMRDSQWKSL